MKRDQFNDFMNLLIELKKECRIGNITFYCQLKVLQLLIWSNLTWYYLVNSSSVTFVHFIELVNTADTLNSKHIHFLQKLQYLSNTANTLEISVSDPYHFDLDPDPDPR